MADFKSAGLCGESPNLNSVLEKMDSLKSSLSSSLTLSPSALSSTLSSEISGLSSSLQGMIPELPSAPDVSLQAELTSLLSIDKTSISGLANYTSKLNSIKGQFGDSLTKSGLSLDSLVSDASSALGGGGDLCAAVPNFKLPSGATEAAEAAAETLMADAPGVAEKISEVTANTNMKSIQTGLATQTDAINKDTLYAKASNSVEIKTIVSNQSIQFKRKVDKPEDNFSETTVLRSSSTEIKSESGGQETIVIAERPRVYPNGNFHARSTEIETYFNTLYDEVFERFGAGAEGSNKLTNIRIRKKPTYHLLPFYNDELPLNEIPYSIDKVYGVEIDDPSAYLKKSGKMRLPRFRRKNIIYGLDNSSGEGLSYRDTFSPTAMLKLNFSNNKGKSTINVLGGNSYAFIRIQYSYFRDYDPRFENGNLS